MRYSGSKRGILRYILPFLVAHLDKDTYFIDLFCGGCNVLSEVDHALKIGNDSNRYVISLWEHLKSGGELPYAITEEQYNAIKKEYVDGKVSCPWLTGYVGTSCSFGGAWFNGYARFNEKRQEDHILEGKNNLERQVRNFRHLDTTTFTSLDYRELKLPEKAVIYCDPPYMGTKKYESDFNHTEFWQWVRETTKKGYKVFVSEYNAPSDFTCIWEMKRKSTMGSRTGKGNERTEKLFIYQP